MQYCSPGIKACSHGVICADDSNKAQFQHLNVTHGQIIHETNSKASKKLETCLSTGQNPLKSLIVLGSKILDN